ncbi:glycosyltransferase, partial [bacterium]|nr:glycosyltransferase [bacterium]NDD86012.1 glycosyltransferase [bacterium]
MAMNVVPIASDVGAVSDVISSEVDGYVVSPGSVKEISEKIMVLAKDNKKLNTMKKLVRKKVEQKYSSRILGTNYKNLYEEIMK